MNYRKIILSFVVFAAFFLIVSVVILHADEKLGKAGDSDEKSIEDYEEGKNIFQNKCNQCHPLSRALSKIKDLEEWTRTTKRMSEKMGSRINKSEAEKIAEYLYYLNSAEEKDNILKNTSK